MAWTLKQRVGTLGVNGIAANTLNVTPSVATTAKSTIIVVVWGTSFIGCTNISASDSAGNTYALKQHTTLNAGNVLAVLVAHNTASVAATSGTIAVAIAGASPADWFLDVYEFASNAGGRGADDTGTIGLLSSTATPSSGASGTVLGGSELVFGYSAYRTTASPTPSTAGPWTQEATAGGNFTSISAWLTGVAVAQLLSSASGTYTNNAVTIAGGGTIALAGALVLVIKEQFDYSEALTTQPTQQTALARALGSLRNPQSVLGPATLLAAIKRSATGNAVTSVVQSTAVAASQAISRALTTDVSPSTVVGVSRKAALTTSVVQSTTVVASPFTASGLFPTGQVLIAWNGVTYTDESAYVRSLSYNRGRAAVNDVFAAGAASVRLRNESGRFGPYNSGSPLYPNVIGGKPIILRSVYRGIVYSLWAGYTTEYSETELLPLPEVTINGIDAFDGFSRNPANIPIQQNQRTDQLLTTLLIAAGFNGTTRFEAGRTLTVYGQPAGNVLQGLQHIAVQELGGAVFMGKTGEVVFQNAAHRAAAVSTMTLNGGIEANQLGLRQSDLIDKVVITYGTQQLSVSAVAVYSESSRLLPALSDTTITSTSTQQLSSAVPGSVSAPVGGEDYTATDGVATNPYLGGGLLDVTNAVTVKAFSVSGATFTLTMTNGLPYPVYLSNLQLTGIGLVTNTFQQQITVNVGSPKVVNNPLDLTIDFVTDVSALTAFATARATALGTQHPRPVVQVVGRTPTLMAFVLGVDLSQRITLVDNAGPWLSGLNGDFFVEHVDFQLQPGQIPSVTLTLFDSVQGVPA